MANTYFFTDIDLLSNQAANQAFGPKSDLNNKNRYQVTSLHTASADPSAYAVCNGIVCIQPQIGSSELVNLVLKPLAQPPFDFPKIKYIVYRGIKADSLLDGDDIQDAETNDLTKTIHTSFNALKQSAGITGNPPKESLGIHLTGTGYENSDPVDYLFYREDENVQFPLVMAGWKIGTFSDQGFGIDLISEALGFDPVLATVRTAVNIIEVDELPSSPSQPEVFEHWHDKEAVLNFIDPCAFFGSFFNHGLRVKSSTDSEGNKKTKNDLYDDVLSKFANKNVVYLDIRNEYNYSFNYFGNYGTDIKLAFAIASTPNLVNYYASGWPLLKLLNSDFPSGNSSDKNVLKLAMPDGDNPMPMIYLAAGYLNAEYPRESKGANKMLDVGLQNDFTDELTFAIPNRSGATTVVSCYIKLKYNKRFDESNPPPPSSGTVIRAQNYLDCLFSVAMDFDRNLYTKLVGKVYHEEKFLDMMESKGFAAVFTIGVGYDADNITLFASPGSFSKNKLQYKKETFSIAGFLEGDNNISFLEKISNSEQTAELIKEFYETSNGLVEVLKLDGTYKGMKKVTAPDLTKIIGISLTLQEWEDIMAIATNASNFHQKYPVYLATTNIQHLFDDYDAEYLSFTLALIGFMINGTNLELNTISTNLNIFTDGWDI